jgi:hypothetical protein
MSSIAHATIPPSDHHPSVDHSNEHATFFKHMTSARVNGHPALLYQAHRDDCPSDDKPTATVAYTVTLDHADLVAILFGSWGGSSWEELLRASDTQIRESVAEFIMNRGSAAVGAARIAVRHLHCDITWQTLLTYCEAKVTAVFGRAS